MSARLVACAALGLCGCTPLPDFAEESLVDRPRVLAIVAEPPEVAPGAPSELSLLLALPDALAREADAGAAPPLEVSWHVCGVYFTMLRGSQYGDQPEDQGCGGGLSVPLPALDDGLRARLPGELTAKLFDDLEVAAAIFGVELPAATVDTIRRQVGLPLVVEARLSVGDKTLRAVKRVLVSESDAPHRNPDPPHFDLLGEDASLAEVVADPEQPLRCVAASGGAPELEAGREVELAPVVPTSQGDAGAEAGEPWLERYQVLNARGELEPRDERAFYSWFSTAGRFSENVTKSPLRNTLWRVPTEPGRYPLFVVVRDGHGGTSACRLDVSVR